MNKKILLIGGGGHCKSVLDCLIKNKEYDEIAIIDKKENIGKKIYGIDIIGSDRDMENLYDSGYKYAFISCGSVGYPDIRIRLSYMIDNIGFNIPNIIDNSAVISDNITLGRGVFVSKASIINIDSVIGDWAIINTACVIEHDCKIGRFVHIASGSVLGGNVSIGDNSHIGTNVSIRNSVTIGKNSIIGIGSVVTKNIPDNVTAYGNPCKIVLK